MADNNNPQVRVPIAANEKVQLRKMAWIDSAITLNVSCMFATLILFALFTPPQNIIPPTISICNSSPNVVSDLRFYLMLSSCLFLLASMIPISLKLYITMGRMFTTTSPQFGNLCLSLPFYVSAAGSFIGLTLLIVAIINLVSGTMGQFSCDRLWVSWCTPWSRHICIFQDLGVGAEDHQLNEGDFLNPQLRVSYGGLFLCFLFFLSRIQFFLLLFFFLGVFYL
ncbi:hypothetical protein PIB30_013336 [Stylosanthes scabra]|uniref:PGG domain-containing protein n=1 Tax=Stylosanthes scabra TaxID=79078 RepID=A0ABU6U5Q2_9FABA|nr:hypothetical protein [Stylosanthes scabra]